MKIKHIFLSALLLSFLYSCSKTESSSTLPPKWDFGREIELDGIKPLGITLKDDEIWISDPDQNRIVRLDAVGHIVASLPELQRPMHLRAREGKIYIPEYGSDSIRIYENGKMTAQGTRMQADALAAVALTGDTLVMVDFYNHRILIESPRGSFSIGTEGHDSGELYYPTDVDIHKGLIYVADAYNHCVQVFDFRGNYKRMIGRDDSIQVAGGVKVSDRALYIADFEGNRVLVYDLNGNRIQTLKQGLQGPADIEIKGDTLYVANYGSGTLTLYYRQAESEKQGLKKLP